MKSAICTGTLHHRRTWPKTHDFQYQVALFYIDLSEIHEMFRIPFFFSWKFPRLAGFDRKRYLRSAEDPSSREAFQNEMGSAVRKLILEKTGRVHEGPIRLLTQISYLGFCFNPVSFYYCFNREDTKLEYIVAEITNTPWNERKNYVFAVPDDAQNSATFTFGKDFHVSPFMPMNIENTWVFRKPKPDHSTPIHVHMEDFLVDGSEKREKVFQATLHVVPKAFTLGLAVKTLMSYPLLTLKTFLSIYYQALRLKLKAVPFYSHPNPKGKT